MRRFFSGLLSSHLLYVLITAFVLVAILTGVLNALVISRVINNYLSGAQSDRVTRDMEISKGLYQQNLDEVARISKRVALDSATILSLRSSSPVDGTAIHAIDQVISREITEPSLIGSQAILVLDRDGNILIGRVSSKDGVFTPAITHGNWKQLAIVTDALAANQPLQSTEIIPASFLAQVSMDQQALVELRETPQNAPIPYDAREGTAGLALVSVYPLMDEFNHPLGAVVTLYLFNNNFSFVDNTKYVAQIETTTIFLGDLRISTNVIDHNGVRAVGTRVSQSVYDRVLIQGKPYLGRVFVVDDWFTGQYEPLLDHRKNVVGMLYVGVRESVFMNLVYVFNRTAALIALVSIIVAGVSAVPITLFIVHPIGELAEANRRLARGDMNVRVKPSGSGEIALLGYSFNNMVKTLQQTQRELLHKEKLASMGQLAAGVAHELNNPLGAILLFADVMYKESPEGDPRHEDLKMIINEAHRCKIIVSDLLNFARQHELLAQKTDLNALIQEVSTRVSWQPRFEQIEIIHHLDPALPFIQADPSQLQQVFYNLFNNAADAMESDGKITMTTRLTDARTVEIRMADTGSGIPAENLDKLFTPFFTTKPAGKGTGLGLAIVYGIIKMHRGQIWVESQLGQGTTIVITLPVRLPDGQLERSGDGSDLIG